MNDVPKAPVKRGEAAWLEQKERISERNAQARKAGRLRREAYEESRAEARRAADRRRLATLIDR